MHQTLHQTSDPSNPFGEHQPRERAVPCRACGRATWNYNALCHDDQNVNPLYVPGRHATRDARA